MNVHEDRPAGHRPGGRRPRGSGSGPGAPSGATSPPGPWPTRISGWAVLAGLTVIVAVAVLGAVAVPRVLAERDGEDAYSRTTLAAPARVAGLPRLAGADLRPGDLHPAQVLLSASRTPLTTQILGYGTPGRVRLVIAAGRPAHPLAAADRDALSNGFISGMASAKAPVTALDPGPLGGWFGCGTTPSGSTLCLAVDPGALIGISVTGKGAAVRELARTARAAVELRSPTSP